MRNLLLALAAFTALTTIHSAPAEAREGPWCLIGTEFSGNSRGDCRYFSYAQCQATASGIRAYCDRNYFYSGGSDDDSYDQGYAPRRRLR
jgi:hypothetical protein